MIRRKDRATFDQLYSQHQGLVRKVLFNVVGEGPLEDLTQEAFLRVWKGLPAFAFRSSLKTWIYRITVNVAFDHLRQRSQQLRVVGEEGAYSVAAPERQRGLSDATQRGLQNALLQLADEDRAMVVLFYFEEQGIGEIAAIVGMPRGTVKSRLHAARAQLKRLLKQYGVDDGNEG